MLIVEMVREEPGEAGFTTFDLQVKTWRKMLEVAEKFGWTPEGTVVDKDSAKRNHDYIAHFEPTYQVEPWGYCKRVTDTDAIRLSRALTATLIAIKAGDIAPLQDQNQVLIRYGMTKEEFELSVFKWFETDGLIS